MKMACHHFMLKIMLSYFRNDFNSKNQAKTFMIEINTRLYIEMKHIRNCNSVSKEEDIGGLI